MTRAGATPTPGIEEIRELAAQRRWQELVRALDSAPEPQLLESPELAVHYADALWRVGRATRSAALARRVEPILSARGDRAMVLNITNILGIALFEIGDVDGAAGTFGDLLEMADEWGDFEYAARASNNLGVHASIQNRYDVALTHYERALASYIRLANLRGVAQTHYNIGLNYRELGFFDKAESHYQLAMSYADRTASEDVVALAESDRGLLHVQTGDPRLGHVFADRARERFRRLGDPVREGEALRVLGVAAAAQGLRDDAMSRFADALEIAARHGNRLLYAEVQLERGRLLAAAGDRVGANEALLEAAARFTALGAEAAAAEANELAAAAGAER